VPSIIPSYFYAPAQPHDNVLIDTGGHRFTITGDGQTVGAQQLTISQDNVTFADLYVSQNTNVVLENNASLTLGPSASINEAGHALAEYGSITINAGTSMATTASGGFLVATLTQNGTLTLNGGGGFAGKIVNNGRIIGYGSLGALSTDANNGLIEAQGGTLTVYESYNAPITGTGKLQIDRSSTLALNSPTAQQINFAGPNATLAVTPNEATGLIVNLTASDVLDVGSSLTLITTTQNTDNTTTLKAYDGQTLEQTFTLQGQWQAADFGVQSDGRGGTDLIAQSMSRASLASWQHLHGPNLNQLSFSLPHAA
jgi:hypothetical protein